MGNLLTIVKGKPEKPPENGNNVEDKLLYSNGDKYVGQVKNSQLSGYGIYYFKNGDIYKGEWQGNKRHGNGTHFYAKDKSKYTGGWQDNEYHGKGMIQYADGSFFQGKFVMGLKHGIGLLHLTEDDVREEKWHYGTLISSPKQSARSHDDKHYEKKAYSDSKGHDLSFNSQNRADRSTHSPRNDSYHSHSHRKGSSHSDNDYEKKYRSMGGEPNEERIDENEDIEKNDSNREDDKNNILFKSNNENLESMEGRAFDVGFETLNIIEHMEMLNSRAIILNKTLSDWSVEDVCDWMRHLDLGDYIDKFKENHVDGKVLLVIKEEDLKNEFQITSFGHRKNFMKAVENLREMYKDQGPNSDYVKKKIQKFYERNKSKLKAGIINNLANLGDGRFYSNRKFYSRDKFQSQDIIAEDDENDQYSNKGSHKSLEKDYHSNKSHKSNRSGPKSQNYDDDITKSAEKLNLTRNESPYLDKRDRGSVDENRLTPIQFHKEPSAKAEIDDFKLDASPNVRPDKDKSPDPSSSETETSSSSEDENSTVTSKKTEEKEYVAAKAPIWEVLNKGENKEREKKKSSRAVVKVTSAIFKSNETPENGKKPDSKKNTADSNGLGNSKRRHQRKRKYTEDLNAKIKDEILRIFKNSGLNENFIINYNELTFEKKIGEGGYGRVSLGKFSGIDVAIKEYGRTKLDTKRAEDFVKEIEVISNLRHPNIVLCMGACIHQGKYLMITEYLEEGSLFDHLHTKHTKIDENTMFTIIEDIALGMTYLHGRKVLHCDLKSSNILIDSTWNVKLCDFGLSRVKYKSDKKRFSNQRVGTPHWMAPEILRGEKYDEAADVYSFGMILWELVTGEIPYCRSQIQDIIASVGYEGKQVPVPTKGPPLILTIMKNCLSLKPNERSSFKEILNQLQQRNKGIPTGNKKGNKKLVFNLKEGSFPFFKVQV